MSVHPLPYILSVFHNHLAFEFRSTTLGVERALKLALFWIFHFVRHTFFQKSLFEVKKCS